MPAAPRRLLWLGMALLLCACGAQTDVRRELTSDRLRDAVDTRGLRAHLEALQAIADEHGGVRHAGSPGYDASVEYVAEQLSAAGYDVERQEFDFPAFEEVAPPVIETEDGTELAGAGELSAMIYSAADDLRAPVVALDFDADAPPGPFRGAGCEAEEWDGFEPGAIALVQPGPCLRREQVVNAGEAGAVAIVVAYPGWDAGEVRRPTLLDPDEIEIPALAATDRAGLALADVAAGGGDVRLVAETRIETARTANVIAELGGAGNETVMLGAHLDSVLEGPGINDNGSGVAAVLEIAVGAAGSRPRNTVRFALWGAEELGVLGSTHYVESLSDGDLGAVGAYINLDMLGSPNGARYVYAEEDAPAGSEEITELLDAYFESRDLHTAPLDLGGASDHGPFIRAGVAVGGVFSGASEPLRRETALDGGHPGEPHDDCYHLACDTVHNVDLELAEELADAVAHVLSELAMRGGGT